MKLFEKNIGIIINLFFALVFMPLILVLGPTAHWLNYCPGFICALVAWLYASYFILRVINLPKLFMERKYPALAAIMIVLIGCSYLFTLYRLPEVTFNTTSLTLLYHEIQASSQSNIVWLTCSLVFGYAISMSFIQELYRQIIVRKDLEYQRNNAELALYKAQINPHFLFNTLNSIYSLILGTSDKAEDAFMKFIDLVRYTYTSVDNETVSASDEIKYIDNYIALQSLRLNSHTKVNWKYDIDDGQTSLPPMIMMTFLENVFKYGVSATQDCEISISLEIHDHQLHFATENSLMKHADKFRTDMPVGIDNCRARLNVLFPARHSLTAEENGGKFRVDLKIQLK